MQWAAYAAMGIGFIGYRYQFASAGGFSNWGASSRGGTDWNNVSASVAQLADLLPFGILLLLFEAEMHTREFAKRLFAWAIGSGMWLWMFYLGSRSRIIGFALAMLAAYYIPRRRNPPLALLAACGLILLISVEFLGQYRSQFTGLSFNVETADLSSMSENVLPAWLGGRSEAQKLAKGEGAEFNCVMGVIEVVPDSVPYDGGHALLEFLTRPIPRMIWPEKRYPHYESFTKVMNAAGIPGARIATESADLVAGPAFTLVGHWYAIGGPIALALASFLTGTVFRTIRGIYDRSRGEADAILYMMLGSIGFNEAAATPLFFLFTLPYTLLPVLLLFRICRITSPARGRTGRGQASALNHSVTLCSR